MAHIAPGVTGTSFPGNFQALKGENCTLIKIRGVKVLEDDQGRDLLKILRNGGGGGSSSELETVVTNLLQRLDVVEKYLQAMPPPVAAKGLKGDKGDPGSPGPMGPQGARGKGATKFSELLDVSIDGIDDGSVPMWSSKQQKWIMSVEE